MQAANVFDNEISSPKRRLMEAKQQDKYFEEEVIFIFFHVTVMCLTSSVMPWYVQIKTSETQEITRSTSELFVIKAVSAALRNIPMPDATKK